LAIVGFSVLSDSSACLLRILFINRLPNPVAG
jgi:hypothetical protein